METNNINGYAVYSRDTLTTMENVTIKGYSGDTTDITSFTGAGTGRWSETGGGAMRIRGASYPLNEHDSSNPTLNNVHVENCCRGIRIQDCDNVYVKDCTVENISDNGIYFAAGSYSSTSGCNNSTIDNCQVIKVGQTGLMNIGGDNNTFKNCTVNHSRGAAGAVWNTNGITYEDCTFTNANTADTTTPWGGNTDDYSGAAFGMSVANGDTSADVKVKDSTFVSGADSVYYKNSAVGTLTAIDNTVDLNEFSGGLIDTSSDQSITITP